MSISKESKAEQTESVDAFDKDEALRKRAALLVENYSPVKEATSATREAWEHERGDAPHIEITPSEITPQSMIKGKEAISEGGEIVKASFEGSFNTLFGRDATIIGLSLVDKEPELVKNIILSLAKRQGVTEKRKSEEEPGKILHEERTNDYGKGNRIGSFARKIFDKISAEEEIIDGKPRKIKYISADSTPLYVKLVSEYCRLHGDDILDQPVEQKDGKTVTLRDTMDAAASWVESKIGPDGLIEVERQNKHGNFFSQTWKDSLTAMIRPDGSLVNVRGRIIYPELQTLAIDALDADAALINKNNPLKAEELRQKAHNLRAKTIETMWSEEDGFFISGIEEKADGTMAPIRTIESTAGRLLNSSLFDEMGDAEKQHYISKVVEKLFSDEFLTEVGIRTRAIRYAGKLDTADYHGSYVSWPTDTFQIAEGLRRQGFPELAEQLENRLLNAVNMASKAYEFFFVNKDGLPILDYTEEKSGKTGSVSAAIAPEKNQGWTFSAALDIKRQRGDRKGVPEVAEEGTWQRSLEEKIMDTIKDVQPYKTREEMAEHYPTEVADDKINVVSGAGRTGSYLASQLYRQYRERRK